jgi:histidinol-phosphate aminotransferase
MSARAAYRRADTPAGVDLRLDGNEGPPRPEILRLARAAFDLDGIRHYPDASILEGRLASRMGVDPRCVLVTAGADEALDRACRVFLGRGRSLVCPTPTFEMLERYAQLAGARILEVPWPEGPYPVDALLARVEADTGLIAIVSPNNPTGAIARLQDLARLEQGAGNALLLVDAAYGEFADEDLGPAAVAGGRALVVRTFSKAWGLAGLRVGHAVGPVDVIAALRAGGGPYPVSGPSLAIALAWLEAGEAVMRDLVARIRVEREALREGLARLGATALPSQANFVLARFQDADAVRGALAARGIAVRSFPGRPLLAGCLRITCPGEAAPFERLMAALEEILGGRS